MKKLLLAALLCGTAASAFAQNAVTQGGSVVVNRPAKWLQNRQIGDAGGLTGDLAGRGFAPFSITDNNGPGLCFNNDLTTVITYKSFCIGHSSAGEPAFTVNGTEYLFPGTGNGNIVGPSPTVIGDALAWNNATGTLVKTMGVPPALRVATNAALKAVTGTAGMRVFRDGFAAAGDGGGNVPYDWSASNCAAADDGAQVQPSGTGCWVADFTGLEVTPKMWGATGDGVADDTTAFQSAMTARANRNLYLGRYTYSLSAVTDTAGMIDIIGYGVTSTYGIKSRTTATTVALTKPGSKISGTYFDCDVQGDAGTGTCLQLYRAGATVGPPQGATAEDLVMTNGCVGIDLSGNYPAARRVKTSAFHGAGCADFWVGKTANAFDPTIETVTSYACYSAYASRLAAIGISGCLSGPVLAHMYITNMQAGTIRNVDFGYGATNGLLIRPGAGQSVNHVFFSHGYFGDTNDEATCKIDTLTTDANVHSLVFDKVQCNSSLNLHGFHIDSSGGGLVDSIMFDTSETKNNYVHGILISPGLARADGFPAVRNITLDGHHSCGNSTQTTATHSNIVTGNGVSASFPLRVAFRNVVANAFCDANPFWINAGGVQAYNVYLGTNNEVIMTDNDLAFTTGQLAAVGGSVPVGSSIVTNNKGIDTGTGASLVSGAGLTLHIFPIIFVTGTTNTDFAGSWSNRRVRIYAPDGFTINAGLCKGGTLIVPADTFVELIWFQNLTCWANE